MFWTAIGSVLWNFASALVGGFVGGMLTAYSIGRWRGEIEQRLASLQEWRHQADGRLERGDDQLVSIPVVESKIEDLNRSIELMREDVHNGFAEMQSQVQHTRETYVTRAECDRQHRRADDV